MNSDKNSVREDADSGKQTSADNTGTAVLVSHRVENEDCPRNGYPPDGECLCVALDVAGHTPGPWSIRRMGTTAGVVVGGRLFDFANGQGQQQVAMVCGVDEDNGSQEANARLIVASPDLLAFARHVAAVLPEHPAANLARCVIAQATGQDEPQSPAARHAIETRRAVEAAHSEGNLARLKAKRSRFGGAR